MKSLTLLPLCLLLLGALGCSSQAPEHPLVKQVKGEVIIPIGLVDDGEAHFFTWKYGEKNVNFFARTDGSGKLRTHFDACYSCYKYKEGYVQEGREVVCIACRIAYNLDVEVWDWVGPCVPVTLKSRVRNGNLVIALDRLEKGAKLF